MASRYLGEFEHMVLLVVLRLREAAFAVSILGELDVRAKRRVARGTLYKTLERLEHKGLLRWEEEAGSPERGGHPRRRFAVTERGMVILRESRAVLDSLWDGLDMIPGDPAR
jgi:DNA-binding PadR family transcriptional regulator